MWAKQVEKKMIVLQKPMVFEKLLSLYKNEVVIYRPRHASEELDTI